MSVIDESLESPSAEFGSLESISSGDIPIRNLWHMLLYAWEQSDLVGKWKSDVESAPTLDALLASILAHLLRQRLRIGLDRDYRSYERETPGLRGRVLFRESIKKLSLQHGRTVSRFDLFTHDISKNQIIRSTLVQLLNTADFGEFRSESAKELRANLRGLVRSMSDVTLVPLRMQDIVSAQRKRNDRDYALMLTICRFLVEHLMPTESAGAAKTPLIRRSDVRFLYKLYEDFVAKFYKIHLKNWFVRPQHVFKWPVQDIAGFLPTMKPDIVFEHRVSGHIVVLDTKFTSKSLQEGQYQTLRFSRDHLFQIYSYVKSQEERSDCYRSSTGILLYPVANHRLSESILVQGHRLRWETVDLAKNWSDIEKYLLNILNDEL
jgi:5-methylcytosine-specific restriction enzyme subunit McrC